MVANLNLMLKFEQRIKLIINCYTLNTVHLSASAFPYEKSHPNYRSEGLSVVAGVGEPLARRSQISNLELLNDIAKVIYLIE